MPTVASTNSTLVMDSSGSIYEYKGQNIIHMQHSRHSQKPGFIEFHQYLLQTATMPHRIDFSYCHKILKNIYTRCLNSSFIYIKKFLNRSFIYCCGQKCKTACLSTTFSWRTDIEPYPSPYFILLGSCQVNFPCRFRISMLFFEILCHFAMTSQLNL